MYVCTHVTHTHTQICTHKHTHTEGRGGAVRSNGEEAHPSGVYSSNGCAHAVQQENNALLPGQPRQGGVGLKQEVGGARIGENCAKKRMIMGGL